MIAPVKKFGRVGLCTNFIPNKHGGTRVCVGSALFRLFQVETFKGRFQSLFFTFFLSDLVALSAFSGTDFTTSFEAFSNTFHSGQIHPSLSLRIVTRNFVLVSFTYRQ